jgi:hypothetical protein
LAVRPHSIFIVGDCFLLSDEKDPNGKPVVTVTGEILSFSKAHLMRGPPIPPDPAPQRLPLRELNPAFCSGYLDDAAMGGSVGGREVEY